MYSASPLALFFFRPAKINLRLWWVCQESQDNSTLKAELLKKSLIMKYYQCKSSHVTVCSDAPIPIFKNESNGKKEVLWEKKKTYVGPFKAQVWWFCLVHIFFWDFSSSGQHQQQNERRIEQTDQNHHHKKTRLTEASPDFVCVGRECLPTCVEIPTTSAALSSTRCFSLVAEGRASSAAPAVVGNCSSSNVQPFRHCNLKSELRMRSWQNWAQYSGKWVRIKNSFRWWWRQTPGQS